MNDWLTVHYDDDEDAAVHPPLSYPGSLAFSSFFFFAWCGNECAFDGFLSTCYIIRNRFYSLVLTISNAYCILLLVLPAISPSLSLYLSLSHLNFLHDRQSSPVHSGGVALGRFSGEFHAHDGDVIRRFSGTVFFSCLPYPSLPYSHTLPPFLCSSEISGNRKESHCEIADITRVTSELSIPFT